MNIPNVKDLVTDNKRVSFVRYANEELWYRCEGGFEFPVTIQDTGTGVFLAEDSAMYFMRWIRRHIETLRTAQAEQLAEG